jgi:peptidoglycan/LPS O-acetylase OafA/YrhL
MSTPSASHTPRFRALDGLRGVAALLVMLSHVEWRSHITDARFITNGYLAVDLFFIMSGLVIAANYSTKIADARSSLRFMVLRFFRLYPLHVVMLGMFVGLECCKLVAQYTFGVVPEHMPFTGGQSYRSLIANIFLVHGLGLWWRGGWNGPSWSISCEFFVYALFAVATLVGLTRNRMCAVAGAIITAATYAYIALTRDTLNVVFGLGIVRCLIGFFWGVQIFRWPIIWHSLSPRRTSQYEVIAFVTVLVIMGTVSGAMIVIVIPLFVVLIALLRSDRGPIARVLTLAPLQTLGRLSYSIYMLHQFVVICILMPGKRVVRTWFDPAVGRERLLTNPWVGDLLVIVMVAVVMVMAFQAYKLIEEPGRDLGRRVARLSSRVDVSKAAAPPILVARKTSAPTEQPYGAAR